MGIDEFMQTNSLLRFFVYGYLLYQLGARIAYQRGWKDGRTHNPKPDVFLVIDMEESTIARIPYNVALEKQILAKPDADTKESREE